MELVLGKPLVSAVEPDNLLVITGEHSTTKPPTCLTRDRTADREGGLTLGRVQGLSPDRYLKKKQSLTFASVVEKDGGIITTEERTGNCGQVS